MERQEALGLIKEHVKGENLLKHMLAVEAIMKGLAEHLSEDVCLWAMAGLLHDIDFEKTQDKPETHGMLAENILRGRVDERIIRAIKAHNFDDLGVTPESRMEKALIAADSISGLIVACALVMPSKKLKELRVETIGRKFKDKDFARGSSRERMLICESIGILKEQLFEIGLRALQNISQDLGL